MAKSQIPALVLVIVGLLAMLVSASLPHFLPESMFWSAEQAQELSVASSRLHDVTFRTAETLDSGTSSQTDKAQARQELDVARARFDQSREALDKAQSRQNRVPQMLRWGGIGLTLAGLALFALAGKENG
jgi:hypothetical protein